MIMFHGTSSIYLDSIEKEGLIPKRDSSHEYNISSVFLSSGIISAFIFSYWKCKGVPMTLESAKKLPRYFLKMMSRYQVVGGIPCILMCYVQPSFLTYLQPTPESLQNSLVQKIKPLFFNDLYAYSKLILPENIIDVYHSFDVWKKLLDMGLKLTIGEF